MGRGVWVFQEAKNKLSEVVNLAIKSGPQVISRRGVEEVVILSVKDFKNLKKSKKKNVFQFLSESPLKGVELNIERDEKDFGRDHEILD